jgi:methionine-rich copper-binding protein CopC
MRFAGLAGTSLAAVFLALVLAHLASAHAKVTVVAWDNPNGPTKLNATATEHISNTPGTYALKVYNSSNAQVDLGDTTIDSVDSTRMRVSVVLGLSAGFYRVDWQTTSADDGHSASGTLYLSLGSDPDIDGIDSASDNCPWWPNHSQTSPAWTVPAGDSDCDGFPDTTSASSHASETFMVTNPTKQCAATPARNDEPLPDAWPVDLDDNQMANGSDLLAFAPVFWLTSQMPNFNPRFDLNASGTINGSDLLQFSNFFGKTCSPSGP